jgi:hypothetical protein
VGDGIGCERLILWVGGMFVAAIISALVMPVIWTLVRIAGLIEPLAGLLGSYNGLMLIGGLVLGALVGGILLYFAMKAFADRSKIAIGFGAAGGAVGGVFGTLLFFPIVVFL